MPPDSGITILVVDDNDALRYLVRTWLRAAELNVLDAAGGEAALASAGPSPGPDPPAADGHRNAGDFGARAGAAISATAATYPGAPYVGWLELRAGARYPDLAEAVWPRHVTVRGGDRLGRARSSETTVHALLTTQGVGKE
jgi:CheY-like chemotaxis protein